MAAMSRRHREEETLLLCLLWRRRKARAKSRRKFWVRSILAKRREQGEFHNLLQEMRLSDPASHFSYLRMSKERFDILLEQVSVIV